MTGGHPCSWQVKIGTQKNCSLLERDCNGEATTRNGSTALILAATKNLLEAVRLVLDAGVDVEGLS